MVACLAPHDDTWGEALLASGQRSLVALSPLIDRADEGGLVSLRNRLLCAGLAELSVETYRALGGAAHEARVREVGALLSLLTKIDDQVIDAAEFHGSGAPPRAEVAAKTRAFLAPTLRSVREATPATGEGRCELAATLGARIAELSGSQAVRAAMLDVIAEGWEVQVEAVTLLSQRPEEALRADVERVTGRISGVWLRMIAQVGELPGDAARRLDQREHEAIERWGAYIQRADALADLAKDTRDGLRASLPGLLLHEREPARYVALCDQGDERGLYELVRRHRVDEALMPGPDDIVQLCTQLHTLGRAPSLLSWVFRFLTWRYEATIGASLGQQTRAPSAGLFSPGDLPTLRGGA